MMFFIDFERERERERDISVKETSIGASYMCPDWELNPKPFVYGTTLQTTEPPSQVQFHEFYALYFFPFSCLLWIYFIIFLLS